MEFEFIILSEEKCNAKNFCVLDCLLIKFHSKRITCKAEEERDARLNHHCCEAECYSGR